MATSTLAVESAAQLRYYFKYLIKVDVVCDNAIIEPSAVVVKLSLTISKINKIII